MKSLCSKSIFFILLCFTILGFSQSNKLYQKTYTKQDGIEIDDIVALCYDNDGFLWLGGSNFDNRTIIASEKKVVLQRFNGTSFHSIPLPKYDNPIVNIQNIYKRNDGKFYISVRLTNGIGALLFDPLSLKFDIINFNGLKLSLGGLSGFVSFKNEDYILIQKDTRVSLQKIKPDLSSSEILNFSVIKNKVLIDRLTKIVLFDDFIMVSDDDITVKVYDWNGKLLKELNTKDKNKLTKQSNIVINEVFIKNNVTYLFSNFNSQLYKVDEFSKNIVPVKKVKLASNYINAYNDILGNAMVFSSKDKNIAFNNFENNTFNANYNLSYENVKRVRIISKDLTKNVWLATDGKLFYYRFPKKSIKNYLINSEFRAIKPLDSVNYLVSTETKGWFKINPTNDSIEPYPLTLNGDPFESIEARNFIFEGDTIWSNANSGIIKVNKHDRSIKYYRHFPILCLEKVNDSTIIYGTRGYKLMSFNTRTETHTPILNTDSLDIYDLHYLKNNKLIVAGTDKGLLTYNLNTKKHKLYNDKKDIEDSHVLMLDHHNDYGYLLGTRSGLIIAFNPETESFKTVYKDDLKAGIATILFHEDLWWINTFNGTVAFNPKTENRTRFSEKDGFSHYEANRYSALKDKNHFFVGSFKGLNYFNPSDLKTENDSASLVLLNIKHFDKVSKQFKNNLNRKDLNNISEIILPSENRTLSIDFALKNTNSIDNGYSYKYRFNDKDWIELKQKNNIQFTNLAAGKYNLEIKADDFSGKTIGDSLKLKINSKEFFYKQWSFFLLITILVISILLWMLNQTNITKRLQQEFSQGLIKSQEDERERIARELHDSISQQLTLIKRKAQKTNQDEITSLTHNTLEEVRAISRGLYPPLLKQLGLTESIEQLILDVDEQTELFVSGDVDKIDLFFNEDQTLNCYRFIQECINNCLKHAEAKALSVSVLKENNSIGITIKDNGKGFDVTNAEKKNSLGLKTIYERIRILKGELTIDSKPNQGTIIVAKIPINNG